MYQFREQLIKLAKTCAQIIIIYSRLAWVYLVRFKNLMLPKLKQFAITCQLAGIKFSKLIIKYSKIFFQYCEQASRKLGVITTRIAQKLSEQLRQLGHLILIYSIALGRVTRKATIIFIQLCAIAGIAFKRGAISVYKQTIILLKRLGLIIRTCAIALWRATVSAIFIFSQLCAIAGLAIKRAANSVYQQISLFLKKLGQLIRACAIAIWRATIYAVLTFSQLCGIAGLAFKRAASSVYQQISLFLKKLGQLIRACAIAIWRVTIYAVLTFSQLCGIAGLAFKRAAVSVNRHIFLLLKQLGQISQRSFNTLVKACVSTIQTATQLLISAGTAFKNACISVNRQINLFLKQLFYFVFSLAFKTWIYLVAFLKWFFSRTVRTYHISSAGIKYVTYFLITLTKKVSAHIESGLRYLWKKWSIIQERLYQYVKLVRLDKPIGIFLLLWPTLWALWIASDGKPDFVVMLIFVSGVVLMRSAGCAINDFIDRDIDTQVKRTRGRPIANGSVSPREAIDVALLLITTAFFLVTLLNNLTLILSVVAVILAVIYPFMKRITYLPQFFLGLAFAWSVPMAFAAQTNSVPVIAWLLLLTTVLWAVAYDTMYAMVDRDDDIEIGVRSTAILFDDADRFIIGCIQLLVLVSLVMIGKRIEMGLYYYAGLAVAALFSLYQQFLIKDRIPENCFKAFLNNNWFGATIFAGIYCHYLFK